MISFQSILYKIYYNFLFYYKNLFIKKKKALRTKTISVLCRGESLKFFSNIKNNNVDLIILANFENDDILKSKILNNIKDIPITIVSNISEPILNLSNLRLINLDEVFISRINNENQNLFIRRFNFRLNSITRNVQLVNSKFITIYNNININSNGDWNTGLYSLFIACTKEPNLINLYGMDFFETDYFYGSINYQLSDIEKKERSAKMMSSFKKTFFEILNTFTNIQFNIYTKSKINSKLKNVKVFFV